MVQAYSYLFEIYKQFMRFIFNDLIIYSASGHNVSFGWFMVAVFIFYILIKNVLMIPKASVSVKVGSKENE